MTDCSNDFARVNKGYASGGLIVFIDHLPVQQHFTKRDQKSWSGFPSGHLLPFALSYTCGVSLLDTVILVKRRYSAKLLPLPSLLYLAVGPMKRGYVGHLSPSIIITAMYALNYNRYIKPVSLRCTNKQRLIP